MEKKYQNFVNKIIIKFQRFVLFVLDIMEDLQ